MLNVANANRGWQRLRSAYRKRGIVLAVGAGLSVDSGIPPWECLLDQLAAHVPSGPQALAHLRSLAYSLAAQASALEQLYRSRREFLEQLRLTLYSQSPLRVFTLRYGPYQRLVDQVIASNLTLKSVAAFCVSKAARGFQPNPQVRHIISLNLDDLLEAYVGRRYGADLVRPIDDPGMVLPGRCTGVYHVHGHVPFAGTRPDHVVLTEQDYFDFFGEPLGAFTYTVLFLLREYPCLFIGLSMRDDNLRRLLYYSARERKAGAKRGFRRTGSIRTPGHYAILPQTDPVGDEVVEKSLRRIGVTVLWVSSFAELPIKLEWVYQDRKNKWSDVF